jgi:hypothetical protein
MAALKIDISNLDCQVHRYVVLVTNAVIPESFWGTKSNFELVLQSKAFLFFVYIILIEINRHQALSSLLVVDGTNH